MVVKGMCEDMCPKNEIDLRYNERLLHILEVTQGTESFKRPLPDLAKVVKAFSRSAAGRQIIPQDVRTPQALQRTLYYLLYEVALSKVIPWHKIYDFIADRLLAVRQDMVIQEIPRCYAVNLLQPMIRFYAYCSFRLCENAASEFDPILNDKQLQECLKKLLVLYDEFDLIEAKADKLNGINYNKDDFEILFSSCRNFFEALYILFHVGDAHSICRGLKLDNKWKTGLVKNALIISICYNNGNWIRMGRTIAKLPPLLAGVTSLHLPQIRRKALEVMSSAYSSANLSYPLEELQKQLLYSCKNDLVRDCVRYNIRCSEDQIKFIKSNFHSSTEKIEAKKEKFVIEKFRNLQPSITLDLNIF